MVDPENIQYGGYTFALNNSLVKFRIAKITPTKIGQFVTLWKRDIDGITQPYDVSDPFVFYIISTRKENHFRQFVFPKSLLYKQGVLSADGKGGKRALRVYPPWDTGLNRQAQKTQKWQIEYFLEIPHNGQVDYTRAKMLYTPNI